MVELGHDVAGFAQVAERLGNEGKSPLYAAIATVQTAASFFTIPAALAIAERLS